jgi:hypothetical protein
MLILVIVPKQPNGTPGKKPPSAITVAPEGPA